jgi:hypothetical protein
VIPTAIVAGFVLAVWLRWWAVAVVAVAWAAVIGASDPSSALGAAVLGAANGVVGAAAAIGLRRLLDASLRPDTE